MNKSYELLEETYDTILSAIYSGDWGVDGACDPDGVLRRVKQYLQEERNSTLPGESNLPSQATAPTEPTTYENGYLRGLLARLYLFSQSPEVGLEELKLEVTKTYEDAMRGA